ncbi:MAG: hypothetical protein ACYC2U_04855 [Candidatus Amoebophilus sp.]
MHIRIILLFILLAGIYSEAHAGRLARKAKIKLEEARERADERMGISSKLKHGTKSAIRSLPGGGVITSIWDRLDGGGMEEKVDRIDKRQKTSLDRIREIAQEAIETKKKVEEMYYFKKQSQDQAKALSEGLKKGNFKKFLGALGEEGLQISLNPADYIPSTPATRKLKEALESDFSLERGLLGQGKSFFSHTRSALLTTNMMHTNPKQFKKEYQKAQDYEALLEEALEAKEQTTIKLYKAEVERLEKEIKLLEETKAKPGLTVSDVMQVEMAIDNKKKQVLKFHEKINRFMKKALPLTKEEEFKVNAQHMQEAVGELSSFLEKDKKRIRTRYSHLWSF